MFLGIKKILQVNITFVLGLLRQLVSIDIVPRVFGMHVLTGVYAKGLPSGVSKAKPCPVLHSKIILSG